MREFLARKPSDSLIWRALGRVGLERDELVLHLDEGVETRVVMRRQGQQIAKLRSTMFHFSEPKALRQAEPTTAKSNAGSFDQEMSMFFAEADEMMKSALRLLDRTGGAPGAMTRSGQQAEDARRRFGTIWTDTKIIPNG